jgi:hypothetical protein
MKFSQVAKGTSAEKASKFRHGDTDVEVLLRPLNAGEEVDVIARATKSAVKDGVAAPRPGDSIYEAHMMSETLALACLDPESPPNARVSTFDEGAKQVLQLDNDTILLLWEQQRMWQEECSPSVQSKSTKDLFDLAKEVAEGDDPFSYVRLSQRTRWQLQHFTAALLVKSPAFRELCSSISSDTAFAAKAEPPSKAPTTPTEATS